LIVDSRPDSAMHLSAVIQFGSSADSWFQCTSQPHHTTQAASASRASVAAWCGRPS